MAYRVETSNSADQDMVEILEYFLKDLSSPKTARRFYNLLYACYKRLQKSPFMYPLCRDDDLATQGFRCAPIMRYIVFYKIDEQTKYVNIYRIIHGMMDYRQMTFNSK